MAATPYVWGLRDLFVHCYHLATSYGYAKALRVFLLGLVVIMFCKSFLGLVGQFRMELDHQRIIINRAIEDYDEGCKNLPHRLQHNPKFQEPCDDIKMKAERSPWDAAANVMIGQLHGPSDILASIWSQLETKVGMAALFSFFTIVVGGWLRGGPVAWVDQAYAYNRAGKLQQSVLSHF